MKLIFSLDHCETLFILNSIKRERKKLKGLTDPKLDELIKKFEIGRNKHMELEFNGYKDISERAKKARREYEKIFFERYGVK